jgi:hypothetical protein
VQLHLYKVLQDIGVITRVKSVAVAEHGNSKDEARKRHYPLDATLSQTKKSRSGF